MIETTRFLTNYFLIAMPTLTDPYFNRSVVYVYKHNENGAFGIIINQPLQSLRVSLSEGSQEIMIGNASESAVPTDFPVLCGGPTHPERGFVIHAPAGEWQSSLKMSSDIFLTTSKDILQAIAKQQGPKKFIFSLGYANWAAGQIEEEISRDFWLIVPADATVLFDAPFDKRWLQALNCLGIDLTKLVYTGGHA